MVARQLIIGDTIYSKFFLVYFYIPFCTISQVPHNLHYQKIELPYPPRLLDTPICIPSFYCEF